MVTKAKGSQGTSGYAGAHIKSGAGQNRALGGKTGAGDARGQAKLPALQKTTPGGRGPIRKAT